MELWKIFKNEHFSFDPLVFAVPKNRGPERVKIYQWSVIQMFLYLSSIYRAGREPVYWEWRKIQRKKGEQNREMGNRKNVH